MKKSLPRLSPEEKRRRIADAVARHERRMNEELELAPIVPLPEKKYQPRQLKYNKDRVLNMSPSDPSRDVVQVNGKKYFWWRGTWRLW